VLTTTTRIKARVLAGQTWSALNEAIFELAGSEGRLSITEMMYNPLGSNDYEYIELKNTGSAPLDMANSYFDQGITFTFPPGIAPLEPGAYLVLVRNREAFAQRYPQVPIAGVYEGKLSNQGEKVTLKNARGSIIASIAYDDENGWPVSADGEGDALVFINPNGDVNDPRNWRASANRGGSPGTDEPAPWHRFTWQRSQ
jgi:hypothetical protein